MDRLRRAPLEAVAPSPCCRCDVGSQPWDRIAGTAYCASCQEELAQGIGRALILRAEPNRCVICARRGTVRFGTLPHGATQAVEMDLCGEHLRGLIGRCLGPYAYHQLRRQLNSLQIDTEEIFLLHSQFYDVEGRALRPALSE